MNRTAVCGLVVLIAIGAVAGCATAPKGPTDEEQIRAQLETLKKGVLGKDMTLVEPLVSADFYYPAMGDKGGALDLLQQGMDMGIVDGGTIELDAVQIVIDGDSAKAGPIDVGNGMTSATLSFVLKREEGVWRIAGGESSGY